MSPHQVGMETVGEGRRCRNMKGKGAKLGGDGEHEGEGSLTGMAGWRAVG